jgi:hypothetical protein
MSEYSIRRVTSLSGVTDVRFVDSSGSTPTFSAVTIDNDLSIGGGVTGNTFTGDGSGLTNINLSGASNYYVTGFTYDNNNNLTLGRNGGLNDLTTSINVLSAVTISNNRLLGCIIIRVYKLIMDRLVMLMVLLMVYLLLSCQ